MKKIVKDVLGFLEFVNIAYMFINLCLIMVGSILNIGNLQGWWMSKLPSISFLTVLVWVLVGQWGAWGAICLLRNRLNED